MKKRKFLSSTTAFLLAIMLASPAASAAPTGLNAAAAAQSTLHIGMESQSDAAAVQSQLLATGGTAILSSDRKIGFSALKVTSGATGASASEYVLTTAEAFSVTNCAGIDLWIKPGLKAEWIEFYAGNVLIKSNSDGDGRFTIKEDFKSGVWTKVRLDLLNTDAAISTVQSLKVRTNAGATWFYDEIVGAPISATPISMSTLLNEDTELHNGRLEFKYGSEAGSFDAHDTFVASNSTTSLDNKTLAGIKVYADDNRVDEAEFPISNLGKSFLSGNGEVLYYTDSNNLVYRLDFKTNTVTQLSTTHRYSDDGFVSYDGSKFCFVTSGIMGTPVLVYYDANDTATPVKELCTSIMGMDGTAGSLNCNMSHDGRLVYAVYNPMQGKNSIYYYDSLSGSELVAEVGAGSINISDDGKTICVDGKNLYQKVDSAWTKVKTLDSSYSLFSKNFEKAYYRVENEEDETSISYEYDIATGISKMLDIDISKVTKILNDGRLFISETWTLYDPVTNTEEVLYASRSTDISRTLLDVSADGSMILFSTGSKESTKATIKNLNPDTLGLRFLLSFDGKNSWYRYRNSVWEEVYKDGEPSVEILAEKGMTLREINAVKDSDFSALYANGATINSVDISARFTSIAYNQSPSIGAIYLLTSKGSKISTQSAIYDADSVDFSGSSWRKINKIYPIEVSRLPAEFVYFIYADGKYSTYSNGSWYTESAGELTGLLADVETSWTTLQLRGMSAQQLRAVPESVLTQHLAGKDFSVVYCMKINDSTTEDYYSKVSVDYIADLFSGTGLSLKLIMVDGTEKTLTGLSEAAVEEFMTWYTTYPVRRGSYIYQVKVGNEHFFVNHNMIQSASVTEN